MAWAINDQVKNPTAQPAHKDRPGSSATPSRSSSPRSRGRSRSRRGRARRGRPGAAAGRGRDQGGAMDGGCAARCTRSSGRTTPLHLAHREATRGPTAPFRDPPREVKEEYSTWPADPQRDRAPRRCQSCRTWASSRSARPPKSRTSWRTALTMSDRHPGGEAACRRARRRRRLRLEARGLPGGRPLPRRSRRSSGRPVKWIEERSENYVANPPRAGDVPGDRARGDATTATLKGRPGRSSPSR